VTSSSSSTLLRALESYLSESAESRVRAEGSEGGQPRQGRHEEEQPAESRAGDEAAVGGGAWGELEPPDPPSPSHPPSTLRAEAQTALSACGTARGASAGTRTIGAAEGRLVQCVQGGVSAEALLLKLRHLNAQNGFLRERVSYLEACVHQLNSDLDKKRTLM
jgi:hypothetical protein